MVSALSELSPALRELRRRLVKSMVLSKLDCLDDLFTLIKLFVDLRWEQGWSASRLASDWRSLLREVSGTPHIFELYFHFPYCKSRCSYCFTNSRVPCGDGFIERYIEEVREEARFLAPLFEGIPFHNFAVGGGTPSLMTVEQLKRFCGPAFDAFRLTEGGQRSIELNPADTDAAKLAALRKLGFNRVSFGVQSMTPETLKRVNRRQSLETVRAAVHGAKAAGFASVGADVIFGMVDEPLDCFLESFRLVAEIRPTEIAVCTLSLTDKYMKATRTTEEAYLRYYEENLTPAFEGVLRVARLMGYRMAPNIEPDSGEWPVIDEASPPDDFSDREAGEIPGSMLGLGRGSRSQIFGHRVYERGWERFAPDAPIFQAAPLNRKEEMAFYILANLELGSRVNDAEFRRRFGTELRKAFSFELKVLKAFGQVRLEAEGLRYLPLGAPQRVFWGVVFALDTLAGLPCGSGLFDGDLRARLEKELDGVSLNSR